MDGPNQLQSDLHPLTSAPLKWIECQKMPVNTSDHQVVLLGDKVYVGGGFTMGKRSTLFIYHIERERDFWEGVDTPTALYCLTTYRSQLLLVGGIDKNTPTNRIWVFDTQGTSQHIWTQPHPNMPTSRWGASAVSMENHLIVAGGNKGGVENPVDDNMLDVVEVCDGHNWKKVSSLPKSCYLMKSTLHEGNWYLAGGAEQGNKIFCTSLESLKHAEGAGQTSVWKEKELPNVPLEHSTPVAFEEHLMMVGGKPDSSAIHAFSSNTNSWEHVGNLNVVCHSAGTVVLPKGELLVVGGKTGVRNDLSHVLRAKLDPVGLLEEFIKQKAELEKLKEENRDLKIKLAQCSDATTSGATTQSSPSGSQVITDTKPRMAQLMVLKSAKGDRVEIIKTVAPVWKQVGFLMDLDPKGQKIKCIEAEHAHKLNGPVVCCQELFALWLDSPDATWGNLNELLIDSEHQELAEQVKNALGP